MKGYALIDLCFPAHAGDLETVVEAATRSRLDAVVYVTDSADDFPDPEAVAAIRDSGGPSIYPACMALGPGYRFVVLVPPGAGTAVFSVLESLGDPLSVQAAVADVGGCALPVSPRQAPDGEVMRDAPRLAPMPRVGVVSLVARGSKLGRDLDVEDTGGASRRILGATGPFGESEDIGRFATWLPCEATDFDRIIEALGRGYGVAIERGFGRDRDRDRDRGGDRDDGEPRKKKRRRRRRRGRRKGGEGGEGGAPEGGQGPDSED